MAGTWITDIRHYLNEEGELPPELHPQALSLALFLGEIISAATAPPEGDASIAVDVPCRRRPGHKPCQGKIEAFIDKEEGNKIRWSCRVCGDNGWISGWQETMWDKMRG